MRRNALKLIAALALLLGSSASAFAQGTPAATSAEKFNIRNLLGQTITLTGPTGGVTPYSLTFPATPPTLNGQILSVTTGGILSWVTPTIGSGTVTSVGLTMPSIFSISGTNPITTAGTFGVTLNNQSGSVVFASPAGGGSGTPAFRALTTTDIPSGLPYVTSFSAGDLSPLFTTTEATPTTTPALSFNLNTQNANTVFAGPVSGGATAPTFRALDPADIPAGSGHYIQNQTGLQSSSNFHISGNGQIEGTLGIKGTSTGFTNITGGAQGASTINYTLPTAQATTAGQVLTNDGSGALTWTSPGETNVQYAQNQFEDFIMSELDNGGASDHTEMSYWHINAAAEGDASGNDYYGRMILTTVSTGTGGDAWMCTGGNNDVLYNKVRLGGNVFIYETRVRIETLSTASQRQLAYTGLMFYTSGTQATGTEPSIGDPTHGVYFVYSDNINGGEWQAVTRNSSTSTNVDCNVSIAANTWYKLRFIVNANGSQVDFYINDVLVGSSTTNIPTTTPMRIVIKTEKTNGNDDRTFSTDWLLTKMIR